MLQRINTENGKRWAIIFNCESATLEDICMMQRGLIEVMITATQSDIFDTTQAGFYETLKLLNDSLLNENQYLEYENFLKKSKQ